jgi:hypothetical protein
LKIYGKPALLRLFRHTVRKREDRDIALLMNTAIFIYTGSEAWTAAF